MTAGVAVPPERPARRTHPDSGDGGSGDNGDRRRRRCPRGAATADVMMTMAGERGGEATARRRRGDGEATARRRRGDGEATARRWRGDYKTMTRQQGCEGNRLWRRRWQGQQGNRQADNK